MPVTPRRITRLARRNYIPRFMLSSLRQRHHVIHFERNARSVTPCALFIVLSQYIHPVLARYATDTHPPPVLLFQSHPKLTFLGFLPLSLLFLVVFASTISLGLGVTFVIFAR